VNYSKWLSQFGCGGSKAGHRSHSLVAAEKIQCRRNVQWRHSLVAAALNQDIVVTVWLRRKRSNVAEMSNGVSLSKSMKRYKKKRDLFYIMEMKKLKHHPTEIKIILIKFTSTNYKI
jgi:hypothetical protein